MHVHNTAPLEHDHHYQTGHERDSERRMRYVIGLTVAMMVVEIVCGHIFNSMALLADGWHMSTHAAAFGIAAFAYVVARRQARNPSFTFGTGKVNALGGFTSAILLAVVAAAVAVESIGRLRAPSPIVFNDAIMVACIGLAVNVVCAWLLTVKPHAHGADGQAHDHSHSHGHDHNLRAAYVHVLADALTSILAIAALFVGKYLGWVWMDPLMGLVGSGLILQWSFGLTRQTGAVLLDRAPGTSLESAIRTAIENDADNKVTDLHVWYIAPGKLSAIVSLITDRPQPPAHYKGLLQDFDHLVHVTVEVNRCEGEPEVTLSS